MESCLTVYYSSLYCTKQKPHNQWSYQNIAKKNLRPPYRTSVHVAHTHKTYLINYTAAACHFCVASKKHRTVPDSLSFLPR